MARTEHDREDLLRDGKQMPVRAECQIDGVAVVIGFRKQGQVSLYFGPDTVFQFNVARELRRVFFMGKRFAAIQGKLCELTRQIQGGKVQFVSSVIDVDDELAILNVLHDGLAKVQTAFESPDSKWNIIEFGSEDFHKQLSHWLAAVSVNIVVAEIPNA
jgi:hypothetical protein